MPSGTLSEDLLSGDPRTGGITAITEGLQRGEVHHRTTTIVLRDPINFTMTSARTSDSVTGRGSLRTVWVRTLMRRVGEGVLVLSGIFLLIRSTGNLGTRSRGAQVGVHPKVGTEGKPRKSDSRGSLKKPVFVGGEMTGSGRFEGDLVTMDVAHGGEKLLSTWMTSWGTMSLTKQRRMQGVVIQQLEGVAVE